MSQVGTVIPDDGLRLRSGPGTQHEVLGTLEKGEQLTLLAPLGDWWGVDTRFGRGFVHGEFLSIQEVETGESEGPAVVVEASYTCVSGDTLTGICSRFGLVISEVATLNALVEPFVLQIGQVLRLPQGGAAPVATQISILNPLQFQGDTEVTSSSLQGHHTPFLGACSCDLDVRGASSPGTPVLFNAGGPAGVELRGVVREVGLACASQLVSDGGRTVKIAVEKRQGGGAWVDTGAWVLYAHLDPVTVGVGDVVPLGRSVGALGPAGGGEYNSSCAQGSHIHIEAAGARCVVNQGAVIRASSVMTLEG